MVAAGGKTGGFSANGGVTTKLRLLAIERSGARDPEALPDQGTVLTAPVDDTATSDMPGRQQVAHRAELWRPYRTAATWYLWQALELAQDER